MLQRVMSVKIGVLIFVLMASFAFAKGQEAKATVNGFAFSPKVGWYSTFAESGGIVGGFEFGLLKRNVVYSVDYYAFEEFTIMDPHPEHFNQIALMYGSFSEKKWRVQRQIGLSYFWGSKSENSGNWASVTDFRTAGIAARLGLDYVSVSFMSVGVDLQANLNLEKSVVMPMLHVTFGKLK